MSNIILSILFISFALFPTSDNTERIVSKLQKKYNTIHDATITFSQHVKFGVTNQEQTFNGLFIMKRTNKFRIELEDRTIVTDGKSTWSYSVSTNQVLIDKYKEDPNGFSPDKIFVNLPKQYITTSLGNEKIDGKETSIIKMIPRDDSQMIKWMKIWVDTDDWLAKKIEILDLSDNVSTYIIKKFQINTGIDDKEFEFKIPTDAEVIDLR